MKNKVKSNRAYRHFKGKIYFVDGLVTDSITGDTLVLYQALYYPYKRYVRSVAGFLEELESREDNVTGQKYRFELYRNND